MDKIREARGVVFGLLFSGVIWSGMVALAIILERAIKG